MNAVPRELAAQGLEGATAATSSAFAQEDPTSGLQTRYEEEHDPSILVEETGSRDIAALTTVMRNSAQSLSGLEASGSGKPSEKVMGLKARLIATTYKLEEQNSTPILLETIADTNERDGEGELYRHRSTKEVLDAYSRDGSAPAAQQLDQIGHLNFLTGYSFEYAPRDDISESSYAESVFSLVSLASSVSTLSAYSKYSSAQVVTATRELFGIFLEDAELVRLHRRAIDDVEIGPERLQRNLRRLFRTYAKNLEDEHTESLEYLASKLVAMKAAPLAKAVVGKYYCAPMDEKAEACIIRDESSEDEADPQPVDENIFEDLKAFRNFLVGAVAFDTLREQIRSFVIPKSQSRNLIVQATSEEKRVESLAREGVKTPTTPNTWHSWRTQLAEALDILLVTHDFRLAAKAASCLIFDTFALTTDRVFITVGILEPPLSPEMDRMRWRCVILVPLTNSPSKN